jgi:hypothetical protein
MLILLPLLSTIWCDYTITPKVMPLQPQQIWSFHSGDYEEYFHYGCDIKYSSWNLPMLPHNISKFLPWHHIPINSHSN